MPIPVSAAGQDLINQRVQTPFALCLVQSATPSGQYTATQIQIPRLLSYNVTRNEDSSSNTCSLVFVDDRGDMFSSNPYGIYSPLFGPGVLDNKFELFTGLMGPIFNGTSNFVPQNTEILLKFTGYIDTDGNQQAMSMNAKTLSLIDLTKQFRFPVNDTYPHPIYGNQTYPYFDPTYNLQPVNTSGGSATQWITDGKMFTISSADPVYGSSHIDPAVYIDTSGGAHPQATPLSNTGYAVSGHIGTCPLYTFDYDNGLLTLQTAVAAGSIVSMAGNPTYMAPENMLYRMIVGLAYWSPLFVNFVPPYTPNVAQSPNYVPSNTLLPQYNGNGDSVWTCANNIAAMTAPRYVPWQIWADENGYVNFYETRYDGPPTKTFLDGQNIITAAWENSARALRTVVRADATVWTTTGDQPVVSLAYNVPSIYEYGQTEPLELNQDLMESVRHLNVINATAILNTMTAANLAVASRPVLSCTAEIWPDPTIQCGDKVSIFYPQFGMDREFIVKATTEQGNQKLTQHTLTLQEYYDTVNYQMGTPSATAGDGIGQSSTTAPPSLAILSAVRMGTASGLAFPIQNGTYATTASGDTVIPIWSPYDSGGMHFDFYLNSISATAMSAIVNPDNQYSYTHLPPNFGWTSSMNTAGQTVYYGTAPTGSTNPTAGDTVYVGPDSIFYAFPHAPPFTNSDVNDIWIPTGNIAPPFAGGSQGYTGMATSVWSWTWWYLCLDGSANYGPYTGKAFRPVQRANPSMDGALISVGANNGHWVNNTWTGGPVPNSLSTYYANYVVGLSNYAPSPPGYIGVDPQSSGNEIGVAFGTPPAVQPTYVGYGKRTKGHYCIFLANSIGQTQFLRIPFWLVS
jgi:hypothetical protein